MVELACGYGSHPGLVRENNEDSYKVAPELGLWLVADGMGGHEAGEVASAIVAQQVAERIEAGATLVEAIESAHRAVRRCADENDSSNMGSTVVALKLDGVRYQIAWVGDSRAYLWDGALHQLTRDHSYVQLLLDVGIISASEVEDHPARNVICQGLGVGGPDRNVVTVDTVTGEIRKGDILLLCSDGVSNEVSEADIASILAEPLDNASKADRLIQSALEAGGKDNATAIVLSLAKQT